MPLSWHNETVLLTHPNQKTSNFTTCTVYFSDIADVVNRLWKIRLVDLHVISDMGSNFLDQDASALNAAWGYTP